MARFTMHIVLIVCTCLQHLYTFIHIYTHVYTFIHMYTHLYTFIHIYTHLYTLLNIYNSNMLIIPFGVMLSLKRLSP